MERDHMPLGRPLHDEPARGQEEVPSERPTEHKSQHNTSANGAASPLPRDSHKQPWFAVSPPSYAQSRDIATSLPFPGLPPTELAPIQSHTDNGAEPSGFRSLPSLSSISSMPGALPQRIAPSYSPPPRASPWPSLNPLAAYYNYNSNHAQAVESPQKMTDIDASSTGTLSAASPDRFHDGRSTSVSLDDPDVRLAAEALGDLRADFVSSPPNRHGLLPGATPVNPVSSREPPSPEPLLSLLTTTHPLLATTIEGATSAYNTSKNFSPRFKTSAEYVEGYLGPIANTVGSVGRVTGVEGGVRWFLGAGRRHQSTSSTDLEAAERGPHKRRKVDSALGSEAANTPLEQTIGSTADSDLYEFSKDRRTSMSTVDTLPAYDDSRSPAYTESVDGQTQLVSRPNTRAPPAWQQRLITSTSGLSVAMSDESLRSLKYCLRWLRWANEHIAKIIATLKSTLEQYDGVDKALMPSGSSPHQDSHMAVDDEAPTSPASGDMANQSTRGELAARITSLKSDVLKTLREVIETVSTYAGGALPENARVLVHRHLTSLPQRFRVATMQDATAQQQGTITKEKEKEMVEGAQKILVLAKEGLDMMSQVSGVLDGTIVSAEEWCDRLGKRKKDQRTPTAVEPTPDAEASVTLPLTSVEVDTDVNMS